MGRVLRRSVFNAELKVSLSTRVSPIITSFTFPSLP
ncbi:BnaA09g06430D [Brassica napus]|uniref:BnaA09g06430D protein n=1 Tax=Brassica napus TaxID=3708 RepID=A0A078FUM6_BRANA|nr:BnaA09g06430D [Brassica napus]